MEDKETKKAYRDVVSETVIDRVKSIIEQIEEVQRYHPSDDIESALTNLHDFIDTDATDIIA